MPFHSKITWPPPTYDVICRNHSNWSSLTCLKMCARDKRPGKKSEKPSGGGGVATTPAPLYVRGLERGAYYLNLTSSTKLLRLRRKSKELKNSGISTPSIDTFRLSRVPYRSFKSQHRLRVIILPSLAYHWPRWNTQSRANQARNWMNWMILLLFANSHRGRLLDIGHLSERGV